MTDGVVDRAIVAESGWSSKEICLEFIQNGFKPVQDSKNQSTRFVVIRTGAIEAVKERSKAQSHVVSVIRDVGSTQSMSETLRDMGIQFNFPKPVGLVQYLVSMVADRDALVLDSFAGSGTTAHAVWEQNKADGGNRHFILVQMPHESEEQRNSGMNITRQITAKRVACVANGYTTAKGIEVAGLGGAFRYAELGDELFDEAGLLIRPTVKFAELARHVYFTETGEPLPRERVPNTPLLGVYRGTAVYLLYNGILKDKSPDGGNVLTRATLAYLPSHDGPKVIYCAGCLLGAERLRAARFTVRQTPREIKVS